MMLYIRRTTAGSMHRAANQATNAKNRSKEAIEYGLV